MANGAAQQPISLTERGEDQQRIRPERCPIIRPAGAGGGKRTGNQFDLGHAMILLRRTIFGGSADATEKDA